MKVPGLTESLANARQRLLSERCADGYWIGELSSSALSTATAVQALHLVDADRHAALISAGLRWLVDNQNEDGGWGDTTISFSNISTTLLCWSALGLAGKPDAMSAAERNAERWIAAAVGSLEPAAIAAAVAARYGRDRTFSVPILMMCALAGRLGAPAEAWRLVMALPFELAVMPRSWFGALRLPVVSYALPALIAIGHARHHHAPAGPPVAALRRRAWPKASRVLSEIQPSSGGYLEATPLTSFVTMALAGSGQGDHPVIANAERFLAESARPDGSWPIDTDLATWGTTLSIKALADAPQFGAADRRRVLGWLLNQQWRERHPYTDAPAGGWAWTDLPGGVPDADDTPGALLALRLLSDGGDDVRRSAAEGLRWLLDLQNRDGGIPTFCRGWGALPFDRSSPDLTAHTIRAWLAWRDRVTDPAGHRIERGLHRALRFLRRRQSFDGAWSPLWFGNQHLPEENNLTYGTAMVSTALASRALDGDDAVARMRGRAGEWLLSAQNEDGGWGGGLSGRSPSSIEETALALEALARLRADPQCLRRATRWLIAATGRGRRFDPSPIGFYFAKLWYHERLYPVAWTAGALARVAAR